VALVTNGTLAPLHSATVMQALRAGGLAPRLCTMPDGESFKTLDTVRDLYAQFAQAELERQSAVIALGGGVVGDTAGFAAATYLRGLPFIQMPTTLLSMVDASVGGKVGVDLPGVGKNLVGAFKQPLLVLADTALLATLPPAEFRAGLAEVVKHGILAAPALFVDLEGVGPRSLPHLIAEAVRVKVNVVEADPFEQHVRAHLNLGHTFAHALELVSDFSIRHGDAVAIGLAAAAHLGVALGACDDALRDRIVHLLARLGLPVRIPASFTASAQQLLVAMGSDKKKKEGRLRFIIPRRIGQVEIFDHVPPALVLAAWREVGV
ncbi:MAG: 3-dehydroquinate synthase, partial [Anaerolineae bacterium]